MATTHTHTHTHMDRRAHEEKHMAPVSENLSCIDETTAKEKLEKHHAIAPGSKPLHPPEHTHTHTLAHTHTHTPTDTPCVVTGGVLSGAR